MTLAIRLCLGFVSIMELVIGAWSQFAPESFYSDFPTVDLTPPYSEHFLRDFGGATLAIALVLVVATVRPTRGFALLAGSAYLVFALPHLLFHVGHLEHATGDQAVLLTGSLVAGIVAAAAAIGLTLARTKVSVSG